jgi:Fe-S cluster assembly protein SufD
MKSHISDKQRAPGPDWLASFRSAGALRYEIAGLPTIREEGWRYTDLRAIKNKSMVAATGAGSVENQEAFSSRLIPGLDSHRLVFIDGFFAPELSGTDPLPEGVTLNSLAAELQANPETLQTYLGSCHPESEQYHGLIALNQSRFSDGALLVLQPGCTLDRPIELVFASTGSTQALQLNQPRNLIIAGEGSRATVIDHHVATGEHSKGVTNAITEISLAADAEVEHYKIQQEGGECYHFGGLFVNQEEKSRFTSYSIALGGRLARTDIRSSLKAQGAVCHLNGLYLGKERQHIDHHTEIVHAAPGCKSNEHYKGILDDSARAVFHGRVVVAPDAQQTDAHQQNKNLLLSRNAEIDTKPQLEIYADDVSCSHGATVGQLDEDHIFFLRARGLDEIEARRMLTWAFANEVLEDIPHPSLHEWLEQVISLKLLGDKRG